MALQINRNLTVFGDINLTQLYVRLVINYGPNGDKINVSPYVYSSKEAYNLAESNSFHVDSIANQTFSYDSGSQGSDILTLAHNNMKSILSTDVMAEAFVLDPSTGEPIYDPSTGLPVMEEVIEIPRFAMDSSISIVDISIG